MSLGGQEKMCVHLEGSLGLRPEATNTERSKALSGLHGRPSGKGVPLSGLGLLPGHWVAYESAEEISREHEFKWLSFREVALTRA